MTAYAPDPMTLEIAELSAGYGQHVVLDKVSINLRRGEWLTLLGPNGVGKSTLLQIAAGQLSPLFGAIRICGYSMVNARAMALHHLGFACQPEKLPGLLTGKQCLEVYAAAKNFDRFDDQVLELAGAIKFTPYLDHYVDTYSLGTRQKLSVLLALLGNPSLIVLDEVFNGLDPASSLVLKRHLRARVDANDCSVLLATHALDIVEHFSDTAALLLNGHVVRIWDRAALLAMRNGHANSLEAELAAATE